MAFYIVLSIVSSCINWAALIIDHVCPILDIITKSFRIYQICDIFTARKRSLGQGNIFAPVCHSVHRGVPDTPLGADTPWDQVHPPGADTPRTRYTPQTRYIPQDQVHPQSRHPPEPGIPPQEQTPPWCRACWEIRSICGWYTSYWNAILYYYRPQRSCGQGNVFTRVCHSVHRGVGCLPQCMLGYHPQSRHPPGADTPLSRHPSSWSRPPWEQTPPRSRHSPRSRHTTPPEQTPP